MMFDMTRIRLGYRETSYCTLICGLLLPILLSAQSLSIEAAMDLVERGRLNQQDALKTEIRREALNEIRISRIPIFYADANMHHNLIRPTTPVPAIAFDPNAATDVVLPLKFATKWSAKAGVQLEWDLFDPTRRADTKEAELQIRKAENQHAENLKEQKRETALAYTAVVLATHQLNSARQDSMVFADMLEISSARSEAGREPFSAYVRAQQEFERSQIRLSEAWAVLWEADLALRKRIDLDGTITLDSDIEVIRAFARQIADDDSINHRLQDLSIDHALATVQNQRIQRGLWPSLRLNAYWGEQYYSNTLRLDREDAWFGNSFVTFSMRVPLSEYMVSRTAFRKAHLNRLLASLEIELEEEANQIHQRQRDLRIGNAEVKVSRLQRIELLAYQQVEEAEATYREGRSLLSGYYQAVADLNRAKQDVWQGVYDLIGELLN